MMSQEPTFPADATPGRAGPTKPAASEPTKPTPAAEAALKAPGDAVAAEPAPGGEAEAIGEAVAAVKALKSRIWPTAGVAIGIGSAAVAAALLYRSRRD